MAASLTEPHHAAAAAPAPRPDAQFPRETRTATVFTSPNESRTLDVQGTPDDEPATPRYSWPWRGVFAKFDVIINPTSA